MQLVGAMSGPFRAKPQKEKHMHVRIISTRGILEWFRLSHARFFGAAAACSLGLALAVALTGCQAPQAQSFSPVDLSKPGGTNVSQTTVAQGTALQEGDSVRVVFPGAPNLNPGVQQIRPDGKISLPLIGEFKAAGLTVPGMQAQLVKLYESQLQTKEVIVTLEASAFTVYVTGAVIRPGKIVADRPLTMLQAVMEAGGFDPNRANMKKVALIRHLPNRTERFTVDLKQVMEGQAAETIKLKPQDVIFVPEKFNWF
jgi:protein involved in polysaccharide export with SLBB domain